MTTPRKAYQSTPHGQVHYAEAGEGFPLLLLGETPRSHHFFRRFQPLLAPHAHVLAVDTPGFGNSHALPVPTTIPAVAGCLIDFIDAFGFDQVDIFGMHTGDKLAAALAAQWPLSVKPSEPFRSWSGRAASFSTPSKASRSRATPSSLATAA